MQGSPTITTHRSMIGTRRNRWRGLLVGLAATLAGTGPSFAADLQDQLLGTWHRAVSDTVFAWLTFRNDGRVTYDGLYLDHAEGFANDASYSLHGSQLTIGVANTGGGDGWTFDTSRVACKATFFGERMELSNCTGWDRNTDWQPVALPDTFWVRSPPPF